MDTAKKLIQDGLIHHQSGRLQDADAAYRRALATQPENPDANHLLGVLAHQCGSPEIAAQLISKAIEFDKNVPDYHSNLGLVLMELGRLSEAISSFQRAIQLNPEFAAAHGNLGNAFLEEGQFDKAVDSYVRALALNPNLVEVQCSLGMTYRELGKPDEAIRVLDRVLTTASQHAGLHLNKGNVLKDLGKLEGALSSYDTAIQIQPDYVQALCNRADLLVAMGRLQEAVICFQHILKMHPDLAMAHNNLGGLLFKKGDIAEAKACFLRALSIDPKLAGAHSNLASLFEETKQIEQAITSYEDVLRLEPDNKPAAARLYHLLEHACAWQEIAALEFDMDALASSEEGFVVSPFSNIARSMDMAQNLSVARFRSQAVSAEVQKLSEKIPAPISKPSGAKIAIGYVSNDMHDHATAHLMAGMFGLHDRKDFEVLVFSYGVDDNSHFRQKIVEGCDQFIDIKDQDDLEAATTIASYGVDILVDLKGHTQGSRLGISALRPAPVQVTYLGFPGTSGADFFDYVLTDKTVTPSEHKPFYSETFAYLPDCYQVTNRFQEISDQPINRDDFELPEDGFVFSSFTNNYKLEPVMFSVWMELLKECPKSVLWLLATSQKAEENLKAEASLRGIDSSRLVFASKLQKHEHLARYRLANLVLDTRIYGGHTTTSDALWAGVPVVTVMGEHFASRVASSILSAVGMECLITQSVSEYKALCLRLAKNPDELAETRETLNANLLIKPLFDTALFTRNLENLYSQMWARYLEGKAPDVIEAEA